MAGSVGENGSILTTKGPLFLPYPKETSTLLVSVSNGGKSYFLSKILQHADVFFEVPISKVYIINHNKNVAFYDLTASVDTTREFKSNVAPPPVEEYLLGEFNIINDAEPNSVVIFEDIQFVSHQLVDTINLACHHKHLAHVFIVAQSVLGGSIFKLLSLVHRVLLFTSSGGIARLANYITTSFSTGPETKKYLKEIINTPNHSPFSTLQIEINSHQSKYLAITNLLNLIDRHTGFCIVYPKPGHGHLYKAVCQKLNGMSVEWDNQQFMASAQQQHSTEEECDKCSVPDDETKPTGYLIVHPSQLKSITAIATQQTPTPETTKDCLSKQQEAAQQVKVFLYNSIDSLLQKQRHLVAKGLVDELLTNPEFCISLDGKRIKLKHDEDAQAVSTIDFIATACRPNGPSEQPNIHHKEFVALTESLLDNGAPRTLIKNKLLLQPASAIAKATKQKVANKKRKLYQQPTFSGPPPTAYYSLPQAYHHHHPPPPHPPASWILN